MLGQRMMMGAAGVLNVVEASFTASALDTTNTVGPLTFSGIALGVADVNRQIVVGAFKSASASGSNISAVSIGGVSATQAVQITTTSQTASLWIANVPTGTTGDIVVSISSSTGETWGIGVHRLIGASTTAFDTLTNEADPMTGTINCPAGGVIIGHAMTQGGDNTHVWTGINKSYDRSLTEGGFADTGAFKTFATIQSGLTITCNPGGAPSNHRFAVASFGPA